MTMTAFSTVIPTPTPLNPSKHVNYALGMVLGVDDFRQEFAYHAGRDKWLARDMLGAGTVRGLDVSVQSAGQTTELVVKPGVALTTHGQIVRVPTAQCAVLDDWVSANQTTVATNVRVGSPPGSPPASLSGSPPGSPGRGTVTLYTVLRYKHCLTDQVPIPGEPCRTANDAMAASRVTDDFSLDLSLAPPAPTEEPGMSAVIAWLARVPVSAGAGSGASAILAAMRSSFGVASSLPTVPLALPPAPPPSGLTIALATAPEVYRAALQLYATTLRDLLAGSASADAVPPETGILLATVQLPVAQGLTGTWMIDATTPVEVDTTRPFLLPLDMLKEAWIASMEAWIAGAASLARYRLVAAGLVPIQSGSPPPPAGTTAAGPLQAWWGVSGEVHVAFQDLPVPGTQYIIKALPFVATSPAAASHQIALVVTSISTGPPGCTLAVFVDGAAATMTTAAGLNLVIEVNALVGS
jgi:hypothetical protein